MQSKFGRFRDVLWSLVTLATAAGVPRVLIVDELRRLAALEMKAPIATVVAD